MLGRRITRLLFSSVKNQTQIAPKPPRFLSGELEPFRYDFQNAQLYDGYTPEELYGLKIGYKHPPAVRAEMVKDNIAVTLIVLIGFGLTYHLHLLYRKELQALQKVQQSKKTRKVNLPEPIFKNPALQ